MKIELSEEQVARRTAYQAFAEQHIAPHADRFDAEQHTPNDLIQAMAEAGLLGTTLPTTYGGSDVDAISHGLLCEAIARASVSVLGLITVHVMAARALLRFGSENQKQAYLPAMARGDLLGGLALTEPEVGSDAGAISMRAEPKDEGYLLSGTKRWITYGQLAHLIIVFARIEDKPTAFLLPAETPGFTRKPIKDMLGFRAAMLAELELDKVYLTKEHILGRPGWGFSHVANFALDWGRYSIAWGSTGLGQACLDASREYASQRQQFGKPIEDHQLIRAMLTDMIAEVKASRLLCYHAGYLKQQNDPATVMETNLAKYYASRAAQRAATNAVQIHGAHGCSSASPVQRYYRDAKIMEIIEGSSQIQQLLIGKYGGIHQI